MRKEIVILLVRNFALGLLLLPDVAVSQQQAPQPSTVAQRVPPIACWFWTDVEFNGDGYKPFIEKFAKHSSVGLITASLRYHGELTDPAVRNQISQSARYADAHGLGLVMDLDVRLARKQFVERFPDQLQELVLVREFGQPEGDVSKLIVELPTFHDHYTHGRDPFAPVASRVLKVYSYEKVNGRIKKGSVKDVTDLSRVHAGSDQIELSIPARETGGNRTLCALVAVTLNTPDVFAPDLLDYQRNIIRSYKDSGLVGAAKDEWGFPGRVNPPTTDLWFSSSMANHYRKRNRGRDLTRDLLLMAIGEQGRERERAVAINHYMALNYERNVEIETDFYHAVKETFGPSAFVGTHPTWFPFPNSSELFKNGLSWWNSKRDLAQVDEATPFAARTALSKKWNSPIWYNMFYHSEVGTYSKELWRAVLGGGRLNIHQPFPVALDIHAASTNLLEGDLFAAIQRIELLDFISASPVNSPVAVVFGHPAAANWANDTLFADVGLEVTNRLWEKGIYADLIPSSEIVNGSLTIGEQGKIQYGPQAYEAVIYYHPEFDYAEAGRFFDQAAVAGATRLYQVGDKSMDFYGKPVRGRNGVIVISEINDAVGQVMELMKSTKRLIHTPGAMRGLASFPASVMPNASGHVQLIDGTYIIAAGEKHLMGDTIQKQIVIDDISIAVDAVGLAGFRFDDRGHLVALACGGMKSFKAGNVNINLPERLDVALIRDGDKWRGVVHGYGGSIPSDLAAFTTEWTRVDKPSEYAN